MRSQFAEQVFFAVARKSTAVNHYLVDVSLSKAVVHDGTGNECVTEVAWSSSSQKAGERVHIRTNTLSLAITRQVPNSSYRIRPVSNHSVRSFIEQDPQSSIGSCNWLVNPSWNTDLMSSEPKCCTHLNADTFPFY